MENGRIALVSGGNRGIGLEVCRQLAESGGYTVVMGSRDDEQGRAAAAGLPDGVIVRQLDVADPESVERLSRSIEEEFGRLDILVNNAGISNDEGQRGVDADLDLVKESLEANLFGAWRLCEMAIPLMRRNGYGRIVNVSTGLAALEDMGGGSPGYRVSKTALNALTRILASELRGSGILVNAVNPGGCRPTWAVQAPRAPSRKARKPSSGRRRYQTAAPQAASSRTAARYPGNRGIQRPPCRDALRVSGSWVRGQMVLGRGSRSRSLRWPGSRAWRRWPRSRDRRVVGAVSTRRGDGIVLSRPL